MIRRQRLLLCDFYYYLCILLQLGLSYSFFMQHQKLVLVFRLTIYFMTYNVTLQ